MKKLLFVLLFVAMVVPLLTMSALATPPNNASGSWYYHPRLEELEIVKVVGGNEFLRTVEDSRWNGTFHGTKYCEAINQTDCAESVDFGDVVFHSNGRGFFKGTVEFASVTVEGKTGSLEMRVNGRRPDEIWKGHWVITGGDGELAGLRGQGTWWGPGWQNVEGVWGLIEYAGNIHFE